MIRALVLAALAASFSSALAAPRALAPAPGAAASARHSASGVQVELDPRAWRWGAVEHSLAPVRVTVTNHGPRPLLVRTRQFALRSVWGDELAALPPYETAGEPETVRLERGASTGFEYAPWSPRRYGDPIRRPSDPMYFHERQGEDAPAIPPNEDVVRRALPEGILQPGGTVTGFLYFPDQRRGTALTFVADVVDATTGQLEGTVSVPLTVQ
jgi:hypothetical protein